MRPFCQRDGKKKRGKKKEKKREKKRVSEICVVEKKNKKFLQSEITMVAP